MKQQQSITTLPMSPADDRRKRMRDYSIAMGIRMVCVILCFFAHGWWLVVPVAGAIILPYIAVVLANVGARTAGVEVLRPGAIVPVRPVPRDEPRP